MIEDDEEMEMVELSEGHFERSFIDTRVTNVYIGDDDNEQDEIMSIDFE